MIEFAKRLSTFCNSFSIHFHLMLPDNPQPRLSTVLFIPAILSSPKHPISVPSPPFVDMPTCFEGIEEILRGTFDGLQNRQIASALKQSGNRFLWVVRTASKGLLRDPTNANLDEVLPRGFIEKTKERGLVWPSLVPQIEILSHEAIGGFVTHSGWTSTMESLWFGVPMVPWPHGAEQHLNAFHVVKELYVAVVMEVSRKNEGFVSATELERAIKCLMDEGSEEGRSVSKKAEEIKLACRKAVEVGGVSYVHLENFGKELAWQASLVGCS